MTVGEKIRFRRKELGMTVDELAEKLGKNRATIYRYESDEIKKMPLDILKPISDVLQVPPGYLMNWSDEQNKPTTENDSELTMETKEIVSILESFSPAKRKAAISYIRFLKDTEENE